MPLSSIQTVKPISQAALDIYSDKVPAEVVQIWRQHGTGLIGDGYFRLVDPAIAHNMLLDNSPVPPSTVVVFATAMADLISWWTEENTWLIAKTRLGELQLCSEPFERLTLVMGDEDDYRDAVWDWSPYPDAAARLGVPDFDDCFMHVPMLGMGGRGDANTMETGSLWIHIDMMVTMTGKPRPTHSLPWPNWI